METRGIDRCVALEHDAAEISIGAELAPLPVTRREAAKTPLVVGSKATDTVQLAPAASVVPQVCDLE